MRSNILHKNNFKKLIVIIAALLPGFCSFSQAPVYSGTNKDNGSDPLHGKAKLLQEVILKSGYPVKLSGDTTTYAADSFKLKPGASVRNLLKKLPGVVMSRSGEIVAMGQPVTKILIDGEEFFSANPSVVLNQFPANMIKDVEVYDRGTDNGSLAGPDDGTGGKTINLKLKDSRKEKYFGKAEVLANADKLYNANILFSYMNRSAKTAVFGTAGNTNAETTMSEDKQDKENQIAATPTSTLNTGEEGIPRFRATGVHYSNSFSNKSRLNVNYGLSDRSKTNQEMYTRKDFLQDSVFLLTNFRQSNASEKKQVLNLKYDMEIDKFNTVSLQTKLNYSKMRVDESRNIRFSKENADVTSVNDRESYFSPTDNNSASTITWKHVFNKPGRIMYTHAALHLTKATSENIISDRESLFENNVAVSTAATDRQFTTTNRLSDYSLSVSYTEPITRNITAVVNYAFIRNDYKNDISTFERNTIGKYDIPVDSLTNFYSTIRQAHKPGINFKMNSGTFTFGAGTTVAFNRWMQQDVSHSRDFEYDFINISPTAFINIKTNKNQNLKINYNGIGLSPSIVQLQPLRDQADPLNQYYGNENLRNSFRHRVSLYFGGYNTLKQKGWWINASATSTQNAFVPVYSVANGKSIYTTVNANGNQSHTIWSVYNFRIPAFALTSSAAVNYSSQKSVSYINDKLITNRNQALGVNFSASKEKDEVYEISIAPRVTINKYTNGLDSKSITYLQGGITAEASVTLLKFQLSSEFYFETAPAVAALGSNEYSAWNLNLSRSLGKKGIEIFALVKDLLNQTNGYERNFGDYYVEERTYQVQQRYWMAGLKWNFRSRTHH